MILQRMKTKATTVICAAALLFSGVLSSIAEEKKPGVAVKVADAVFVRPISLGATVAGGVVFVLALPVTAIRKEVKPAAEELITKPVYKTFKRPLGDMDAMAD